MDCLLWKSLLLLSLVLLGAAIYVMMRLKKRLKEYDANKNTLIRNAYFNPVTDLPNRLNIELVLGEQIDRCLRHNNTFLVAIVKLMNYYDVRAHSQELADAFMVEASNRLLDSVRDEDILGHITDDGFVIVFNEYLEEENFHIILERIKEAFKAAPELDSRYQLHYEVRVGVSKFPDHGTDISLLLDQATKEALK
jgi:diguanylate cyclase (GGDEF)-like protein